ncbi:hypothetical protein Jolie1_09 [Mycobacterium phage Julie1]|uniref:DUF7196 domain-containing protein n=1 Tax=Mycobacterium phage Julie1 TaxID=1463812 RepID=W8EIM3_9CAUD|nr:hypothetical protein CG90_gp09 [Mycobacterium phage Julie1]AHJ88509.1 hypothetical protein Jolie1_09 [Mycobacterium phage Julie1]
MCGCNGGAGVGKNKDSMGWYVQLPQSAGGGILPEGVNPADPEAGEPGYMIAAEAQRQVTLAGGGTIRKLVKAPATPVPA